MNLIGKESLHAVFILKCLFYFVVYLVTKILKIYACTRLFYNRTVLAVIPFSYLFMCRFGDCHTVLSSFSRRYYDFIRPHRGMFVVDIGAHIGTFTVRYGKKLKKSGVVISIEPEPNNYELL